MKYYTGCAVCGVRKKFHAHKTCGDEAKYHGLNLVGNFTAKNHVWVPTPEPFNFYGKAMTEAGTDTEAMK